jgi:hypothetical protein
MGSFQDYRKRAEECVNLAQKARQPDREKLLQIANAWIKLADDQASLISHDMIQVVPTEQHEKSL